MIEPCVVRATMEHTMRVGEYMREDDRREIWASAKSLPHHTLMRSYILSDAPKTIMFNERPIAMFGVVNQNVMSGYGVPWLLGTEEIEKISFRFLRGSREHLAEMLSEYKRLENFVDVRNTVSIKWLRWLGFDMMEPAPYGPFGLPFHRFVMENK